MLCDPAERQSSVVVLALVLTEGHINNGSQVHRCQQELAPNANKQGQKHDSYALQCLTGQEICLSPLSYRIEHKSCHRRLSILQHKTWKQR